MTEIEIVEVESAAQLRQFIGYPNYLYRDDPNYVTPLMTERLEFFDQKKNPFYRSARVKMFGKRGVRAAQNYVEGAMKLDWRAAAMLMQLDQKRKGTNINVTGLPGVGGAKKDHLDRLKDAEQAAESERIADAERAAEPEGSGG